MLTLIEQMIDLADQIDPEEIPQIEDQLIQMKKAVDQFYFLAKAYDNG